MHTEAEIRKAIKPLLDKYGELSTTEVKQRLDEVLVYDDDDKEMSTTRNEILIIQRIGNIVAHQNENFKVYNEGFAVDKNARPAKFIAVTGTGGGIVALPRTEVEKRRRRTAQFVGKSVNWDKKRERDEDIGNLGEEFVYEYEKHRVAVFAPDAADRVQHLSRIQGDGLGYDISSVNSDGSIKRIEVKTTTGDVNTPFYMSRNEKFFFETFKEDGACIYRVYTFNSFTRRGAILVITAEELLRDYNFDPETYVVTKY